MYMKNLRILFIPALAIMLSLSFNSCESCVKKVTKKATDVSMSAMEGVVEAIDERGEELAEKTTDAAGKVAVGTGRSLDKLMDEHAEKIAASAGRTLVQTIEGIDKGVTAQYYDNITINPNICTGVNLDMIGKIKSKGVVDAYFIILEKGTYTCKFEFNNNEGKTFLTKEAEIAKDVEERRYSMVSFALSNHEEEAFKDIKDVRVIVTKK